MERVDTTSIMCFHPGIEQLRQEYEAQSSCDSSNKPKNNGKVRLDENISYSTNDDSSSQSCILNMINLESSLVIQ